MINEKLSKYEFFKKSKISTKRVITQLWLCLISFCFHLTLEKLFAGELN